jgi:hypothetical protein
MRQSSWAFSFSLVVVGCRSLQGYSHRWGREGDVRSEVLAILIALTAALSACTATHPQFGATDAAQNGYNEALAEYQTCYTANRSNVNACEKERLMLEANTKMLATTLASRQ